MTKYFGEPWDAPILVDTKRVLTPIGVPCAYCSEPIAEGDQGLIERVGRLEPDWNLIYVDRCTHRECALRAVIGGIAHVEGRCTCCGGDVDPDDGLGWRESARRVLALVDRVGVQRVVAGYLKAPL